MINVGDKVRVIISEELRKITLFRDAEDRLSTQSGVVKRLIEGEVLTARVTLQDGGTFRLPVSWLKIEPLPLDLALVFGAGMRVKINYDRDPKAMEAVSLSRKHDNLEGVLCGDSEYAYPTREGNFSTWLFKPNPEYGRGSVYVPLDCIVPLESSPSIYDKIFGETETNNQPKEKEEDHMVYRVTAILTPSVVAQQSGATETVLLDNVTVVAADFAGAALLAGAANADKLTVKALAGGTVRVVTSEVK